MRQPGKESIPPFQITHEDFGPLVVSAHVEYVLETESRTFDEFDIEVDAVRDSSGADVSRFLRSDWAEIYRRANQAAEALKIGESHD